MVSGLVTSPNDHCSIFSGDASEMRIASKSARRVVLVSVKLGLIFIGSTLQHRFGRFLGRHFSRFSLRRDQLDVETERLQLADEHVERLGEARGKGCVTLHNGLVNL